MEWTEVVSFVKSGRDMLDLNELQTELFMGLYF